MQISPFSEVYDIISFKQTKYNKNKDFKYIVFGRLFYPEARKGRLVYGQK
jgi:hypothetical protein